MAFLRKIIPVFVVLALATSVTISSTTDAVANTQDNSVTAHAACPVCVVGGVVVAEEAGGILGPVLVSAGAAATGAAVGAIASHEASKVRDKPSKKSMPRKKRRAAQRDVGDTIKLGEQQLKQAGNNLKRLGKMWRKRFGARYIKKKIKGAVGACVAASIVTAAVEFLFEGGHVDKEDVKKACVGASFGYLLTGHAKASGVM